jgi:adenine-specific DNA-methyltransferase
VIWYARNKDTVKYRQLFSAKHPGEEGSTQYLWIEDADEKRRPMTSDELIDGVNSTLKIFQHYPLVSIGVSAGDKSFD